MTSETLADLAAIRERDAAVESTATTSQADRRALLAHIDALAAKVEGLPTFAVDDFDGESFVPINTVSRAAVLAILRGE